MLPLKSAVIRMSDSILKIFRSEMIILLFSRYKIMERAIRIFLPVLFFFKPINKHLQIVGIP